MKQLLTPIIFLVLAMACTAPQEKKEMEQPKPEKIRVIFDTDTNNELDDQHALAYLLFNGPTFDVEGVTVVTTTSGGNIDMQYEEAVRIMKLCTMYNKIPLLKGADGNFPEIQSNINAADFDGSAAVDFIIEQANKEKAEKLVLIAVGKLTNVALALKKAPAIAQKMRVVWLGSNYPEPGEHNQDSDTASMNYVLNTSVPFEMVTVRYGKSSGTDAVKLTKQEAFNKMPGLGPVIDTPIVGRHGGEFNNFGDYSVNLFEHIDYHGDPPSRPLFDMVAVAIVKNERWAERREIPCPILIDNQWVERPDNTRKIILWENFDKEVILRDFFAVLNNYQLVDTKP
jgi:purine nucleosidase